jgi:NAD(P)-dependent dehydrogenase (short-subunit alcohol dehydrogenase family)
MNALAAELGTARGYRCDVSDAAQIEAAFGRIVADLGPVDVQIWNAGKGVWGTVEDVRLDAFEAAWRTNAFGAFAAAKAVVPAMKARGSGNILFIGAASRRGGAKTVAFAAAKAAQRSLAESLARHLWPHGIHVALVIVDGIVDEPLMRTKLADKPDDFFVKPKDIADTLVTLTWQRRSAWSFELEARPFGELGPAQTFRLDIANIPSSMYAFCR